MGQLKGPSPEFPPLFILSGPREIGKTTFLKMLIDQTRHLNIQTAGVLSPALNENGQKIGIDLIELRTGNIKHLATLRQMESEGVLTDRWAFSKEVMDWGNQVLARSIPCQLLIVDELGPIELERGQGWQNGITALSSNQFQAAVVVIRPELIEKALALWPQAKCLVIKERNELELAKFREMILAAV
jgi:nucleoside-triphosphatase THEP1